jgi:hypothetical protein
MWHILHLVARPIEALLGVFCLVTATLLYPKEDGTIQSKLEDFWVRVDDYKNFALSKHAAFMTQVAQLETRFLDRVFGKELFSGQALGMSICFSLGIPTTWIVSQDALVGWSFSASLRVFYPFPIFCLAVGATILFLQNRNVLRRALVIAACLCLALWIGFNSFMPRLEGLISVAALIIFLAIVGIIIDIFFIAATRRLLRWAGTMSSSARVLAVVVFDLALAFLLTSPLFLFQPVGVGTPPAIVLAKVVALGNLFDVLLALLFVLLAVLLLVHRVVWPLLSRALFRMADIGTKGRRAILAAVGTALLGTAVFGGKFPELLAKLIGKLGG